MAGGYTSRRKSDGTPRKLREVTNVRAARRQARRILETRLGRKLQRGELVHHKDHDPLNNSPGNLTVVKGQRRHAETDPRHSH